MKNIDKLEIIKIKLGDLKSIIIGLSELLGMKLKSGKFVYRITRKITELNEQLKSMEDARIKLCETYCLKDSDGNALKVDNNYQFRIDGLPVAEGENVIKKYKISDDAIMHEAENHDLFKKAIDELFDSEIETKWIPVTVEWLDKNSMAVYTENILRLLDTFIIDPEGDD